MRSSSHSDRILWAQTCFYLLLNQFRRYRIETLICYSRLQGKFIIEQQHFCKKILTRLSIALKTLKIITRLSIAPKTNVVVIKYICLEVYYNISKFQIDCYKIDWLIDQNTYVLIKRDLSVKTTSNLFFKQIYPKTTHVQNFKFLSWILKPLQRFEKTLVSYADWSPKIGGKRVFRRYDPLPVIWEIGSGKQSCRAYPQTLGRTKSQPSSSYGSGVSLEKPIFRFSRFGS